MAETTQVTEPAEPSKGPSGPPAETAARVGVPAGVLEPFFREIIAAGHLSRADGSRPDDGVLSLTARGQAEVDRLIAAWKAWLMEELSDWLRARDATPAQNQEVEAALGRITIRLIREAEAEARYAAAPAGAGAAGSGPDGSAPAPGDGAQAAPRSRVSTSSSSFPATARAAGSPYPARALATLS